MHQDQHVTMTLAFPRTPDDLHVIGIRGRERLNAPFCFDVDWVSRSLSPGCEQWLHDNAVLTFGLQASRPHVVHGQIHSVRRLIAGPQLSLYRLRLMPHLQRLANRTRRHAYNGLTVPQIIERLLGNHRPGAEAARFEHLIGHYPPREHCLQFDESDLHLLHRLCEEEGISYRFEHGAQGCVVVFSDDPAGFPEWPEAARVEHLAEQLSMRTCYSSHFGDGHAPHAYPGHDLQYEAGNQTLWTPCTSSNTPEHRHQLSVRSLERVRCERREIIGRSAHSWLRSGQVIRVHGHPDATFNDQWLLTEVWHRARRLTPLQGVGSEHLIRILQAMAVDDLAQTDGHGQQDSGLGFEHSRLESYTNRFRVIPWVMPFRPALLHPKPVVPLTLAATLIDTQADATGRVRIRYDWQADSTHGSEDNWARVVSGANILRAGARLQVAFFEGDPDQPVVCGAHDDPDAAPHLTTHLTHTLHVDGTTLDAPGPVLQLRDHERLHIDSPVGMSLSSTLATLSMTRSGIEGWLNESALNAAASDEFIQDLRLMDPADAAWPLAHCTWYIVRMPTPDMAQLARLSADAILFEGKSDAQGWLGLSPRALARLYGLMERSQDPLWLVHPGHCRPLQPFFHRV